MINKLEGSGAEILTPWMAWTLALIAPLILAVVVQLPLYEILFLRNFIEDFPSALRNILLLIIVVGPSYMLLISIEGDRRKRLGNVAIFSALMIVYVPMLWFIALYAACFLFSRCV